MISLYATNKRARRNYLTAEGVHLAGELSDRDAIKQILFDFKLNVDEDVGGGGGEAEGGIPGVAEATSSVSITPATTTTAAPFLAENVFKATAELNQLMNLTGLLRGGEYLKLLPAKRTNMQSKGTALTPLQQARLTQSRFAAALTTLRKGRVQGEDAVVRRRLYCEELEGLRGLWNFVYLSPLSAASRPGSRSGSAWDDSLFIDASFARGTAVTYVSYVGSAVDSWVPLNITSAGRCALAVPRQLCDKPYFSLRLSLVYRQQGGAHRLIGEADSWASAAGASAKLDTGRVEEYARLSRHSELAQQVFRLLRDDLLASRQLHVVPGAALPQLQQSQRELDEGDMEGEGEEEVARLLETEALRGGAAGCSLAAADSGRLLTLLLSPALALRVQICPIPLASAHTASGLERERDVRCSGAGALQADLDYILAATLRDAAHRLAGTHLDEARAPPASSIPSALERARRPFVDAARRKCGVGTPGGPARNLLQAVQVSVQLLRVRATVARLATDAPLVVEARAHVCSRREYLGVAAANEPAVAVRGVLCHTVTLNKRCAVELRTTGPDILLNSDRAASSIVFRSSAELYAYLVWLVGN